MGAITPTPCNTEQSLADALDCQGQRPADYQGETFRCIFVGGQFFATVILPNDIVGNCQNSPCDFGGGGGGYDYYNYDFPT